MTAWFKDGEELIREINEFQLPDSCTAIWPIGQVGFFIKHKDKVILIDPVLTPITDAKGESYLCFEAPFAATAGYQVDAVLCTHDHMDHLNYETVNQIAASHKDTKFYIPRAVMKDTAEALKAFSDRVYGLRQLETIELFEGCTVTPIAASHDHYATDEEGNEKALGYVFSFDGYQIFHAGDTLATDRMISELKRCGQIDLLLMPINGRDWVREGNTIIGNSTPQEAALFAEMIDCKKVIPTHYDLWKGNGEEPLIFAHYMKQYGPDRPYHFLKPGELYICSK